VTELMPETLPRYARQDGRFPALLAGMSLVLLVAGLAVSAGLGGTFPSPFADAGDIARYFATESDAVRATAVFSFASAVPLAIAAAAFAGRLRRLGVMAPGGTVALAGGVLSAGMLAQSALLIWVLSRREVRGEGPLVRALQYLSFLSGGVAHVAFLGLLVAGIAVPGLLLGLLPRPVAAAGFAIAAVAGLATVSLVWDQAAVLLPIARFPGLIWLVVAGYRLPRERSDR
jgi:hypothetical protein